MSEVQDVITLDNGDFRTRFLLGDGLLGKCLDEEITYIMQERMDLVKAVSVIERELNKKVYHEAPVLLVAVGSYQATAAYNEWSVDNILKDFPNNVTGAVKKFDENLKLLKKTAKNNKCKIVMCSLMPLPEQNSNLVKGKEKFLSDQVSRLFVEFNNSIDRYNAKQGESTLKLKKFLDKGDKQKYVSTQRYIKMSCYTDAEDGQPKLINEMQEKLMGMAVRRLRNL